MLPALTKGPTALSLILTQKPPLQGFTWLPAENYKHKYAYDRARILPSWSKKVCNLLFYLAGAHS